MVKLDTVREAYESVAESRSKPSISFDELLSSSDFDDKLDSSSKYMKRLLATKEESATGHLFINGKHYPMTAVSLPGSSTERTLTLYRSNGPVSFSKSSRDNLPSYNSK